MNKTHPAGFFSSTILLFLSIAAVNILLTSSIVGSKESKQLCFFCYYNYCLFWGLGKELVWMMDAIPFAQLDVHQSF